MPLSLAHFRIAVLVNSVPLSLTMLSGLPWSRPGASGSRATRAAGDGGHGNQGEVPAAAVVLHGQDPEPA